MVAPGDDGDQGRAASYDLRVDTSPLSTDADFRNASSVQPVPLPSPAGSTEEATVNGLSPDSTYHFAIRAFDDGDNASPIGTTPSGTLLPDQIPPAAISAVQLTDISTSAPSVTLQWTATGDDSTRGTATSEHLWFDTTPIEAPSDTQTAQQISLPNPVPAGQQKTVTVEGTDGLQRGETYYFALGAKDNAGNQSPLATAGRKAVLVQDIEVERGGVAAGERQVVSETQFVLNETQNLKVVLYDLLGRRVRVLLDERVREGFERTVRFQTRSLSSGPYFLRFVGEQFATTRKIMVVQ